MRVVQPVNMAIVNYASTNPQQTSDTSDAKKVSQISNRVNQLYVDAPVPYA